MKIGMKKPLLGCAVAALLASGPALAEEFAAIPAPEGHPLDEIISGYEFRSEETQSLQDDDFDNPGYLWVDKGEELWSEVDGSAGKACTSCHGDAADSMSIAGAEFPKWNENLNRPVSLEQQINLCRTEQMGAEEWKLESDPLLSMTVYVRNQARGEPMQIDLTEGEMQSWADRGEELYYTRVGQLDMACANCHEDNYGNYIRSDHLSQGQSNGFPLYRLKWQKVGSLHRRFKGCMKSIRAEPYKPGEDEFLALEIYLGYRGVGLPVETPAVRQ